MRLVVGVGERGTMARKPGPPAKLGRPCSNIANPTTFVERPVQRLCMLGSCAVLIFFDTGAWAAGPFRLIDGDRVVLIGSTLIEREQREGYWETALTRRFPTISFTVRNLGWSGDTVWGHARAGFGSTADGFRHLKEHVQALKPTVLVVAYGANESFDGAAGLERFVAGVGTLLDAATPEGARLVFVGPPRQEDLGRPLPDPTQHNKDVKRYSDAIAELAVKRGSTFVPLFQLIPDGAKTAPPTPLTDNGIHLTPWGYWRSARTLELGLGLGALGWRVELSADNRTRPVAEGTTLTNFGVGPLHFDATDDALPMPPAPVDGRPTWPAVSQPQRMLRISHLAPGDYTLRIDGKQMVRASAELWERGVTLDRGPELDQAERLRRAIVAKNELYFHRWRPQNDTYLYGFRRHEQGKNAAEIPRFDPLIARQEAEIARLHVPVRHTYELRAVKP